MLHEINAILDQLRSDFVKVSGKPFKYFFCPILWADEDTELCMGHIVNKAFQDSAGTCIVQRKDVDGFYGSVVEADFEILVASKNKSLDEIILDPTLNKKIHPQITVDGKECKHYTFKGHKPSNHTRVQMQRNDGAAVEFVLQKSPAEVATIEKEKWEFVVERDYRIPAIASLIKSAHLTLFHIFGYRYALSAAGEHIGRHILGTFYCQNKGKSAKDVRKAADAYFCQFANIVRPVNLVGNTSIRGTIEDNKVFACYGSSGKPFAIGVFVRTNKHLHCVLVPEFVHLDEVRTYLDFLTNSNERLATKLCRYDRTREVWETSKEEPTHILWPKRDKNFIFP